MDHITQLYQNRAKVLQEKVNHLEKLLKEVAEPPVDMAELARKAKEKKIEEIQDAEDKQAEQDAKDKAKAEADAKWDAEHPVAKYGKAAGEAAQATLETGGNALSWVGENPLSSAALGIGGLLGLDLLRGQVQRKSSVLGKALPTTANLAGKAIEKTGEWWNKSKIEAAQAAKAAEDARAAAAETLKRANIDALQNQALDVYGSGLEPHGTGARAQRLAYDPAEAALFPNRPAGAGAPKPATRPGAFEMVSRVVPPGEQMNPAVQQRILTGNYSTSPGMIGNPEALESGLEGVKNIVMTGKDVGNKLRTAATGLGPTVAGIAGELAGEYVVKPAAENLGLTDLVAKGISAIVPNSILAAGNSPAEDERADEEISNNLKRLGIKSGRLRGPMGIDIGKK